MKKLFLILAFFSASAFAQTNDGNELLKDLKVNDNNTTLAEAFKHGIAKGFIAGVAYESTDICPQKEVKRSQYYDVVQNYLEQNPAIRHEPRGLLVFKALNAAFPCKKPI
jgi:lipid-binding SYLF domain-containing protein